MTDGLAAAQEMARRAAAFQAEADAAGYGRPVSRLGASFHGVGMRATLTVEVAVVRSDRPRKCEQCGMRRIAFALTFTDALVGNPDHPWRCAPCWGLR